jgi:hypothetical protein
MLKNGPNSMRSNYKELMTNVESPARHKQILTIAKKHNISYEAAQYKQALAIIKSKAK